MLEVIHGSAWCDRCEKNFNAVVMLNTGFSLISICSGCLSEIVKDMQKIEMELKDKGM